MSTTSRRPIAPDREVVPPCSPLPRPPTVEVVPPTHAPPAAMAASAHDREVVMPSAARPPMPLDREVAPPSAEMAADREVALAPDRDGRRPRGRSFAFGHSRLRASSRSEPPTGAVLF